MHERPAADDLELVDQRLKALGVTDSVDIGVFWTLVKRRQEITRGQTIECRRDSATHLTVLLEGLSGLSTQYEDGTRRIHNVYYPGDPLGIHSSLFPQSVQFGQMQALSDCTVGMIDRDELEEAMQHHPALGEALWRAAMMEARIFRQRFVVSGRPALHRVAHLLCEHLARLGMNDGAIRLHPSDIADTAGLSAVHINRILQELDQLGVLTNQRLPVVLNKERLQELAAFDGAYLNPSSQWDIRVET